MHCRWRVFIAACASLALAMHASDAAELVPMSQLLRQGFELKAVVLQPPLDKDGYATERLYLQKGSQVVVCVFNLKPPNQDENRMQAYCAVGLYEGR